MSNKVRIAIDAMGGENSPKKIIEGIEIYRDMTLMGCKSVSELNRSKVVFRK